jgi:hypothetical protein
MPDTVVGLFRTRIEADGALGKLKEAGFGPDRVAISTPQFRRRGHYGVKVLVGIAIGILLGAFVGAVATGMVPGVKPLVTGNLAATFLFAAAAGAATGLVAGMLVSMAASGDSALFYEQEVESGRILITVTGPDLERAWAIMRGAGAMEAAPVEAPMERPRPQSG